MEMRLSVKLSFPPIRGVHPPLTLKAVVSACNNQDGVLPESLVDDDIARDTDSSRRICHIRGNQDGLSPERCCRAFSGGCEAVFLLPSSYANLRVAALQGPAIILIASKKLCSVIVVLMMSGEPHHVRFPRITLADLEKPTNDFARAIRQASLMELRTDQIVFFYTVRGEITLPIVNVLQSDLIGSHITHSSPRSPPVRKLVSSTANPISLSGDDATRAGALEALRHNIWMHLACHGKQDRELPYNSCFAVRDQPLALLDSMENDTPHAESAFLSACHTAVGDEKTPNEAIHLAAGLQFSGFKNVIGMLWVADDAVAKHIVEAFYENMFENLEDGNVTERVRRGPGHSTMLRAP
ncbi:CHAT domain-containing protein [Suillus clintonianus]|uniref:CHAT domain-containing protein n=1 Tax=Suillus clintonianus TaxID=1904413 RepID=UPI001B87366E|nr:CHAT domain-containing protein [Suillus clintonianus]KAG2142998.1 CHAT domain-containing protein [Suillus clintonianus]